MLEYSSQRLRSYLYFLYYFSFMTFIVVAGFLFMFSLSACTKPLSSGSLEAENRLHVAELGASESERKKAALVNVELGLNYLSQDQIPRAKQKLMHAIHLANSSVEPHSALAYFFEKVGDFKEAEREHKSALRLGGMKGALYNNYGAFLYRQNRFDEAKHAFARALQDKRYEHTAEVYENAGLCALKLNDYQQAENYFDTAIRQDPKRSQAKVLKEELYSKRMSFRLGATTTLNVEGKKL